MLASWVRLQHVLVACVSPADLAQVEHRWTRLRLCHLRARPRSRLDRAWSLGRRLRARPRRQAVALSSEGSARRRRPVEEQDETVVEIERAEYGELPLAACLPIADEACLDLNTSAVSGDEVVRLLRVRFQCPAEPLARRTLRPLPKRRVVRTNYPSSTQFRRMGSYATSRSRVGLLLRSSTS